MHRGSLLFAGVLSAGFASLALAQSPADWRFAQPNSDLRMSVNVQKVLQSPGVAEALKRTGTGPQAAQTQMALGILSSIDRISISTIQKTTGQADALVLVKGRFDPKVIQGLLPKTGTTRMRQVSADTILIGEGASFEAALLRMNRPRTAGADPEAERSDIWIEGGPGLLKNAPVQASNSFPGFQGFSLGIRIGDAPEFNLILKAAGAAAAKQMLAQIQAMVTLGLAQNPQAAEMIGKALDFRQDGARVRVHFVPTPEMMAMARAQMQQMQAQTRAGGTPSAAGIQSLLGMFGVGGPAAGSAAPGAAAGARTTTPPAPSNGGKIMIYGLDGGPREVQQ